MRHLRGYLSNRRFPGRQEKRNSCNQIPGRVLALQFMCFGLQARGYPAAHPLAGYDASRQGRPDLKTINARSYMKAFVLNECNTPLEMVERETPKPDKDEIVVNIPS